MDRTWVAGLIAAELLVVVGLHALAGLDSFSIAWSDMSGWLDRTLYEDAVGVVVLLVALVLAYWLLLSTLSYRAVSLSGRPVAVGVVPGLTLPPIRRLVNRAVALSIATSMVAGPLTQAVADQAGGGSAAEVIVEVDSDGRVRPPGMAGASEEDAAPTDLIIPPHLQDPPVTDPSTEAADPEPPPETGIPGSIVYSVTVRRGDHLWSLSEQHLQRVLSRSSLSDHEVARYWVRVIDSNRTTIRSGNPDLIFPGEVIVLPAVPPDS